MIVTLKYALEALKSGKFGLKKVIWQYKVSYLISEVSGL